MAVYTQAEVDTIIDGLIIDNNTNQVSPSKVRRVLHAINSRVPTGDPSGVSAAMPLHYDQFNNNFYMDAADVATDGYVKSEDIRRIRVVPFGEKHIFAGPEKGYNVTQLEPDDVAAFVYINSDDVPTFFIGAYKGGDPEDIDNSWTLIMSNPYK